MPLPGLYVHVPFCRSKCLYCDFYSVASSAAIPAWLQAVQREVLLYKDRFHHFDSLYLGGGTPAILDERDLATLLECLRKHFTFSSDSEMTIEANPDGLTKDKLKAIKDLGINRISLGVQSLDDTNLKYLGRTHSAKQALEALAMIRTRGFENVSADLIYGLETQSLQGWKNTISKILEFGPEHLSCYQLSIEKGTALGKMKEAGKVRPISEKMQTAFFIRTSRYLERQGYHHYEISNFARNPEIHIHRGDAENTKAKIISRGGAENAEKTKIEQYHQRPQDQETAILVNPDNPVNPVLKSFSPRSPRLRVTPDFMCRHNRKYWGHIPYLGLGPSAHSFQAGSRWWNVKSIKKYCELLAEGKAPVEASEVLSEEQLDLESLDLGLRTSDGIALHALKGGLRSSKTLEELQKSGLVKVSNGRIQPTRKGFLVADSLPLMFLT